MVEKDLQIIVCFYFHFTNSKLLPLTLTISCAICLVLFISNKWPLSLTKEYKGTPLQKLQSKTCSIVTDIFHSEMITSVFLCIRGSKKEKKRKQIINILVLPCDNGKVRWGHAGAHEQDDVLMSGLPVVHHLLLKKFQVLLVIAVHLHKANGYLAMPATPEHLSPTALESRKPLMFDVVCSTTCKSTHHILFHSVQTMIDDYDFFLVLT